MHYHGTPVTPRARLLELAGCSFCVSYAAPRDVAVCHEIGQAVMLDNGAFTTWQQGLEPDWPGFYSWAEPWLDYRTTWAVIPDVIVGDERANDLLVAEWPFGDRGAPVWHMHEPLSRLLRLAEHWPRVCIGSSGDYAVVADARWHRRMIAAMNALCDDGPAPVWLHMLRGTQLAGSAYPFASVDSTSIAQNHAGAPSRGLPPKDVRRMARDIDSRQCAPRWRYTDLTAELAL